MKLYKTQIVAVLLPLALIVAIFIGVARPRTVLATPAATPAPAAATPAATPECDPSTGLLKTGASTPATVICPPSNCITRDTSVGTPKSGTCIDDCDVKDSKSSCNLFRYINLGIQFVSVVIGIIVTILIIVSGIQYTLAGSDPNNVAKAKKRMSMAIGTLVGYGLLFALLQYLVPGGIIR